MTLLQMFSIVAGMEALHRYSQTRLAVPESVLSHTGAVALLCLLVGEELNCAQPKTVAMEPLLCKALVHDLEEVFMGDIARPLKYESKETKAMFTTLADKAFAKVVNQLQCGDPANLKHHYDTAKDLHTREGTIVAIIDILLVAYKVWDEVLVRNNYSIMRVINVHNWHLPKLQQAVIDNFPHADQAAYLTNMIVEARKIAALAHNTAHKVQIGGIT